MEDNRDILILLCQFIRHRRKTHEVKPKECKTCKESDNIINYLINKYSDQETIEDLFIKIEEIRNHDEMVIKYIRENVSTK